MSSHSHAEAPPEMPTSSGVVAALREGMVRTSIVNKEQRKSKGRIDKAANTFQKAQPGKEETKR